MSKRLTDTEKWRDEWYGSLPNDYRIVWMYLVDTCNHAGIWKKDFRGLNFNCNVNLTEDDVKQIFNGRLVDCGGFFFIPKFLKFQYPQGLNSQKPVILSVVKELQLNNLTDIVTELLGNDYLIIKSKSKDIDKDKSNEKEKSKSKETEAEVQKSTKEKPSDLIPENWPVVEFDSFWAEFVEVRRKKKRPLTHNAVKRAVNRLVKLSGGVWRTAEGILIYSIDKGYDDFYLPPEYARPKSKAGDYARTSEELIRDRA